MIHTPPGLDVVCYSNGYDYVRGMRYAVRQAKAGRVVMTVDSTAILNERHVSDERDDKWMFPYPIDEDDEMTFDEVVVYKNGQIHRREGEPHGAGDGNIEGSDGVGGAGGAEVAVDAVDAGERMDMMLSGLTVKDLKIQLKNAGLSTSGNKTTLVERMLRHKATTELGNESEQCGVDNENDLFVPQAVNIGIVTYGNGVRTSLRYVQEANALAYGEKWNDNDGKVYIDVIDCPCLSETPSQLRDVLIDYDAVVFADVCKAGPQFPLAGMISDLQSTNELPRHWQAVGAINTYNPLGNTSTFLSEADIGLAVEKVLTGLATD